MRRTVDESEGVDVMRTRVIALTAITCAALWSPAEAQVSGPPQTEGGRVIGFEPTMGVLADEVEVFTARQGRIPVFGAAASQDGAIVAGLTFDDRTWRDDWSTVTRNGVEVRYHNDDDMRRFRDSFFLNGQEVFPGYPVTAALIDADGRVWASLHATSSARHRWRTAWKVYSAGGVELFSLENPSRERVHDAAGDLVMFVRDVQEKTVEVAVRRLSDDRAHPRIIW
jgi:hypothetical protein